MEDIQEFIRHKREIKRDLHSKISLSVAEGETPGERFPTHTHTDIINGQSCPCQHPNEETFKTVQNRIEQKISYIKCMSISFVL